MGIGPIHAVNMTAPANATATDSKLVPDSQVVSAVQELNQSELMGEDRELAYRRDPKTGQFVVQILKRETGDVVDQIPPEVLLRLQQELRAEIDPKGLEE